MLFKTPAALLLTAILVVCGCGGSASTSVSSSQTTPVIQWATPAPVPQGTVLSAAQLNATASVSGVFFYSPRAGTPLGTIGSQALSVNFYPDDTKDYNPATATVNLSVTAPPPPAYTWKSVPIVGGGFVTGIVMHPGQQGLMYARTDIGGAYRWNSTTKVWVPLTDWITRANSNYMGIESVAIDPSDPQRVYLAAGTYTESFGSNGAMLLSGDQGATFTTVPLPFKNGSNDNGRNAGERLAVDPNLGTVLFFGSRQNGLWKSADRGLTWTQISTFPVSGATSGAGIVFIDFIKSSSSSGTATQTIYAGVSAKGTGTEPASLYVSNDAGTTWSAVPGAPTGLYVTRGVQGPDGALYFTFGDAIGPAGLTTGAVYQYVLPTSSVPAGTWNNITPPRPAGTQGGYGAVALDASRAGTIMVSTLDHYYPIGDDLWRSLDYGHTWYSINTVGAARDVSLSPWLTFGNATLTSTTNWVGTLQIDPFDSNHVVHGSGQTILTTANMTRSDAAFPSNWTVGALGLEECVVLTLISPPSGPANLLSGVGDLGGFQHADLTHSPAIGAFNNPRFGNATSLDFAEAAPATIVRVGSGTSPQFGALSTDSGTTWTPFLANPAGTVNGSGRIAIASDAKTIVWAPGDTGATTSWSADSGKTWTASTGATANQQGVADRINPSTFYIFDTKAGALLTSTDAGRTFTTTQTGLPTNGSLKALYDAEGDLWLATSSGLYHATKGTSLMAVSGVSSAWALSAGLPRAGTTPLTLFLGGTVAGQSGLFRSSDSGSTWTRIDDAQHTFGYINVLQADPRIFGRIYVGTGSGRGIISGDSNF